MILNYNFSFLGYILKSSLHTVDYHYSQILHFSVHLLAKIYLYPQNNACHAFMVTHRHGQRIWKLELCTIHVPVGEEQRHALPSCFSNQTVSKGAFRSLFGVTFPTFLFFLLVLLLFKMPPTPAWCCTLIFNLIQNADLLYQFLTYTDIFTTKHTGAFGQAETIVS